MVLDTGDPVKTWDENHFLELIRLVIGGLSAKILLLGENRRRIRHKGYKVLRGMEFIIFAAKPHSVNYRLSFLFSLSL
jgi:hypothetical protein